jgi:secretion/DNA translocation related TadE-like protein
VTPPDPDAADDDVWQRRRRWSKALRRWAGSTEPQPGGVRGPRRRVPIESPKASSAPAGGRWPRWVALLRRRCGGRPGRDRGAATIFVLAVGLVMVGAGLAGAAVGSARIGRHQAQLAADLGALAGAMHAIEGARVACAAAAEYVAANAARLSACEVDGLEIVVRVDVAVPGLPGPVRWAHAAARAGPVTVVGP